MAAQNDLQIVVATGIYTHNDVPMYFHFSGPGTMLDGPEIMTELFVREITDLGYRQELIAAGSYLGMDRFGLDSMLSFDDRVDTVARMCERGHADKMVLSHDASCYIDWLPEDVVAVVLPNWHYRRIHNDVLPALRRRGVTDDQITTMLVDNPRAIFSRRGAYE
ncbi:hypothetical protein MSAR_18920 [Mycolicibacterium sarraceniae]|uniref:Phosphotriesterase n=1 Tax=Mycolicibacterium sarraceniae TaxID=1534348 RepID=A0A7I7SSF6_9MYCO|nr:hypothetical protein MSAR_18920 [Mycolicibacterium sarraceniae]